MKRLLLFSILFLPCLLLQAQVNNDSLNKAPVIHVETVSNTKSDNYKGSLEGQYFSISTDLVQLLVLQPNIGIEFKSKNLVYGVNVGIEYPISGFTVNPLANGQYTWPAYVYHGDALRLYLKWFYNIDRPANYFCIQAVYKYLWYNNVSFQDQVNSDPLLYSNYTMNEKTTFWGFDIIHGHEFCLSSIIHVDFFYGVGLHTELRQYNVLTSAASGEYGPLPFAQTPYVGSYKSTLTLPEPIMGLKIGFDFFHKNPSN